MIDEHLFSDDEKTLLNMLRSVHVKTRKYIKEQYNRVNPFYEDLFAWKERGKFTAPSSQNVTIYNSATVIGDVKIGDNTWIGPFCMIDGSGGLTIGANCSIATGTQIMSHDTVRWAVSGGQEPYEYSPTSIGDCCFLGAHSVIVRGVTIGKHSIIGAGAVVTKDVPEFSIVAGAPARIIGHVSIQSGKVSLIYTHNDSKSNQSKSE